MTEKPNGVLASVQHAGELLIQALILLSLASLAVETIPGLPAPVARGIEIFETVTIAAFTIEYVLRFAFAKEKLRFVFSPLGLIDLLAIVPFYIAIGVDLRSARALRLFRLIRLFKLVRYNRALLRYHRAILIAKEEIVLFLGAALLLLYFAAVGIYYFEHDAQPEKFASIFHALWWAVCTLTTVGYGDVYPITVGGKVFTVFILLLGLGVVAVPTGLLSSALMKAREFDDVEEELAQRSDIRDDDPA